MSYCVGSVVIWGRQLIGHFKWRHVSFELAGLLIFTASPTTRDFLRCSDQVKYIHNDESFLIYDSHVVMGARMQKTFTAWGAANIWLN